VAKVFLNGVVLLEAISDIQRYGFSKKRYYKYNTKYNHYKKLGGGESYEN